MKQISERIMLLFSLSFLVLITFTECKDPSGLLFELKLEKEAYGEGEPIYLLVKIHNQSATAVNFDQYSEYPALRYLGNSIRTYATVSIQVNIIF